MEKFKEINTESNEEKSFFKSWRFWKPFLSLAIGGLAGYLYYHFIGCSSGTCAITSNPYMSILYGGFFGYFIVNSPCASGKY